MVLLKYQADYSDEFYVYGFRVVTEAVWEEIKTSIKAAEYPQDLGFGTNESILYEEADEFFRDCDAVEISDTEADCLNKLFPRGFGRVLIPGE